ncbi:MAG: hypothetical protein ACR2PW_02370 [Gammaproteobacteria bacterium]
MTPNTSDSKEHSHDTPSANLQAQDSKADALAALAILLVLVVVCFYWAIS